MERVGEAWGDSERELGELWEPGDWGISVALY